MLCENSFVSSWYARYLDIHISWWVSLPKQKLTRAYSASQFPFWVDSSVEVIRDAGNDWSFAVSISCLPFDCTAVISAACDRGGVKKVILRLFIQNQQNMILTHLPTHFWHLISTDATTAELWLYPSCPLSLYIPGWTKITWTPKHYNPEILLILAGTVTRLYSSVLCYATHIHIAQQFTTSNFATELN